MWSTILYITLVGLACAEHGWKNGNLYRYEVRGRTMAGLHQVADQYTGVLLKGKLTVQPKSDDTLNLQVYTLEQAEVHANLSDGWSTYIEDHDLSYKKLPMSDTPFELKLKNGVVDKMYVDKMVPTWEVNVLKAIASQLQVDTQAKNLKKSRVNHVPVEGQTIGVYRTVEDTVTGECETIYDISPLPQYILQSLPELVPLPNLIANGQVIDIVKTNDYNHCKQRMAYHFGLPGLTNWEPASNHMGSFLSRSSVSRIIVTGTLKSYTIQSSVTTNKIILAPHIYNKQKGIVASSMNLTLEAVTSSSESPRPIPNVRTINNLVYEYNAATKEENAQNHLMPGYTQRDEPENESATSESSSQSSSSSSEEGNKVEEDMGMIRSRRTVGSRRENRLENDSTSSSSDSSSDSDSYSNSSEDFWQTKPTLNEAPKNPFMPFSIGYLGNSIQASSKINVVSVVDKIVKEIGEDVLNGNSITGENTLSKFTMLINIMQTMDVTQLLEATEKLYYPYSKVVQRNVGDDQLYQAWVAFRDAVAEVGTGPALLTIKHWILTQKITGAEAAHIVGVLPESARYPTTEYINTLFELMKNEEVQKQTYLNTSIITAFTDLVRNAQVNREMAHKRYPVHSFGRLTSKTDRMVTEQYITYFENQLKKAVQEGDSPKIQIYIHALGNIAHPKILGVFEPYLEGQVRVSDFQRLTIVAALDKMTKVHPKLVRSVLFKIYQNSGETPEVRVAAVMQIMKTNPPAQILQRMAQHTNYDHSRQVNAAVKSAIENAARLRGPKSYQLAQNAKSAVHLLTTKDFGIQQSHNFIRDYVVKEEELMYKTHLAYIQGEDSLVPSSAFYTLWRTIGGYKRQPFQLSWMISNTGGLLDLLYDQFTDFDKSEKPEHGHSEPGEGEWTLEKIGKLLNIETKHTDQVEGNILLSLFGTKSLFTFDNHTIEQLPEYLKYAVQKLRNVQHFNYNKIYNKHVLRIGFPTATGLPFFYTYSTPTRAHFAGEIKLVPHLDFSRKHGVGIIPTPKSADISGIFEIMYTTKTIGTLGFTTPYDKKTYVAVVSQNFHVGVPVQATAEIDFKNNKFQATVQPREQNRNQKIFESSMVAYTTIHDIFGFKLFSKTDNTKKIHVRPVQTFETTVGQDDTGFAFDLKAESEQKFMDWATLYKAADKYDVMSALLFPFHEGTINNNNFTVTYNPRETTAKYMKLFFTYGELGINTGETVESVDNGAVPSSTSVASEQRQNEFLRRAGAGIRAGYAQMVDMGVQFGGQTIAEYVTTATCARSHVNQKHRCLFYFGKQPAKVTGYTKPYQVALQVNTEIPIVPITDYEKALQADPTTHISAKLYFGENVNSGGKMYIEGVLKQSEGRRGYVEHHPMSAVCRQQMQEGNYLLPACRCAIANANYLDQYNFTITYEKVTEGVKTLLYKVYTLARNLVNHYVTEDIVTPSGKEGQVDIGVMFAKDLKAVNISIVSPVLSSEFKNLYVMEWIKPLVVVHPEYGMYERIDEHVLNLHFPTCVVDKNQATTFDNRSYPINIGKCWHTMVHSLPKAGQVTQYGDDDFSILVREGAANLKELMILLGKFVVQIQPTGPLEGGKVKINGQVLDFSKESITQVKNKDGDVLVQIYALPNGVLRFLVPETGTEVIYDGIRILLQINNNYRGKVRGLCGTFDGEYVTDFTTPKNCIIKDPLEFAATYAIVDGTCEGPAKELNQRAKISPCYEKIVMLGDVISDVEAGRNKPRMRSSLTKMLQGGSRKHSEVGCTNHRVEIVEQPGKTCFSLRPLVSCSSKCKPTKKIEKKIDFYCVQNSSASKHWVQMTRKGANPDFSQKPANAWFNINVPERCISI